MGRHISDWDLATSATPAEVALLFPKTFMTGEKYGTVTVLTSEDPVEVTTFRTEGAYSDGRRPESVEFVTSLEEDLSRRDFTINSMAASPAGEVIDPFGGAADIENRTIRCVGDPESRFSEDALRMFRAFRFRAQLGFSIEPETLSAIYANASKAGLISAERVRVELEKTLMSDMPETAAEMIKAGLLSRYLAEDAEAPRGLEEIAGLPAEPVLRWCAFCFALLDTGAISSAAEFLREMRLDSKTASACSRALSIPVFPETRQEIKRLLAGYGVNAVRCAAAAATATATATAAASRNADKGDNGGGAGLSALSMTDEIIASGECFSLSCLAVTGSDLIALGHQPGREIGKTLDMLLSHVLEHPEDNVREVLLKKL